MSVYVERARVAALSRSRTPDDPELVAARRDLTAATLAEHIRRVVDTAPPLTDDQRTRLADLLRGGRPAATATAGAGGDRAAS